MLEFIAGVLVVIALLEFTNETIKVDNRILHRIRAIKDFGTVRAGDLGGFIESEKNLSHEDLCWVADNALVYGNARVYGEALVFENAQVCGNRT